MKNIFNPDYYLSYMIQLGDLITLKIAQSVKKIGELSQLLQNKREAMLTSNFSDRLLNIMGNYFSKIGTPDVMSHEVFMLYKKVYPGEFFDDINEYNDYNRKPK